MYAPKEINKTSKTQLDYYFEYLQRNVYNIGMGVLLIFSFNLLHNFYMVSLPFKPMCILKCSHIIWWMRHYTQWNCHNFWFTAPNCTNFEHVLSYDTGTSLHANKWNINIYNIPLTMVIIVTVTDKHDYTIERWAFTQLTRVKIKSIQQTCTLFSD